MIYLCQFVHKLQRREDLLRPRLRRLELADGIALVRRMDAVLRLTPADEERSGARGFAERRDDRNGRAVPLKDRATRIQLFEDVFRQSEERRAQRQAKTRRVAGEFRQLDLHAARTMVLQMALDRVKGPRRTLPRHQPRRKLRNRLTGNHRLRAGAMLTTTENDAYPSALIRRP